MNKIAMYKGEIYKTAGMNYDSKSGEIYIDSDDYTDFLDVNPNLEMNSKKERDTWKRAAKDAADYVNSHPLKDKYIEEEAFNIERRKIKSPKGELAYNARATAGTVGGALVGAGLGSLRKSKTKTGKVLKAVSGGLVGTAVGGVYGVLNGDTARSRINEKERTKKVGPPKYEAWDSISSDMVNHFKDKRYGY